jgi:DNA-binding CsgD family transcriptional regulator
VTTEDAGDNAAAEDGEEHARQVADRIYERSISGQALGEVLDVLDKAHSLLSSPGLPPPTEIDDLPAASAALAAIWDDVRTVASGDRRPGDRLAAAEDLVPFLIQVRETEDEVQRERAVRQSSAMRNVQGALSRFQQSDSVSDLIESTPAIVCTLGFDRAILSRIHESMWVTEALHVMGDKEWAEEILQAGRQNPEKLVPGLFETEIVRRKRAVRVTNVQQESRVHRAVADASGSRSYVAAPLMPRAQVIGFLHADRYFHKGELTDFDRDVLSIFTEGFGYALERAILMERLGDLRSKVLDYSEGLNSIMSEKDGSLSLGPLDAPAAVPRQFGRADDWPPESRLTRREVDVLELMAVGDTNARIASKLVISEGTVKSHAKHILRKLGAANRAEAVSIWHSDKRKASR